MYRFTSLIFSQFEVIAAGILLYDPILSQLRLQSYKHRNPKLERFCLKIGLSTIAQAGVLQDTLKGSTSQFYAFEVQKEDIYTRYAKVARAKWELAVPVRLDNEPLGLLVLDYSEESPREAERDRFLLELLAGQLAYAIQNRKLLNRSLAQSRNFQYLHLSALTLGSLYQEDTSETLRMILLAASGIAETEFHFLIERDGKSEKLQVLTLVRKDSDNILEQDNFPGNKTLAEALDEFNSEEPAYISSSNSKILKALGIKNGHGMLYPMVPDQEKTFILILVKESSIQFSDQDTEALQAFAAQARITIHNAHLYQQHAQKERLEREIEIAQEIQRSLLPKENPETETMEFSGIMDPARGVGGDYYDFITNPDQTETLICLGDVSGKGVSAGLVMATVRTVIHSLVRKEVSTWEIIRDVNTYMNYNYQKSATPRFMSLSLLEWRRGSNTLHYSGAGQGDMYLYRASTGEIEIISTGGIVLGILPDIEPYRNEHTLALEPGDILVLCTDGVTDFLEDQEPPFIPSKLISAFKENAHKTGGEILKAIHQEVIYSNRLPENPDDVTLVAIKRKR